MQTRDRLYIDGQWVTPAGQATIDVVSPSQSGRGRELGRFGLEEFLEYKSLQLKPEPKP